MKYLFTILAALVLVAGCDRGDADRPTNESGQEQVTEATPTADGAPPADDNVEEPTHNVVVKGAFQPGIGDASGLPDDSPQKGLADVEITPELAERLNEQSQMVVEQVLQRHGVVPTERDDPSLPTLTVEFGDAVEANTKRPQTHTGLLVRVDLQSESGHRAASRQLPPADNAGELGANLDHTLDALVRIATEQPE